MKIPTLPSLEFSNNDVLETAEINENIDVDLDANGNLVTMTIEHALRNTTLRNVNIQLLGQAADGIPG